MKYLLLVGLIAVLLITGCEDNSKSCSAEPDTSLSAQEIIAKAAPRFGEVESFHFDLQQENGRTPIAMGLELDAASGDVIPPDRLEMTIEATFNQMFVESGLITVGEKTYMRNPLNKNWEELSDDFQAVTLFQPETGIKAVMKSATGLSIIDAETFGGICCYHLKGIIQSESLDAIAVGHAAEGLSVPVELWIGTDDFLLRKVTFTGQICEDEDPDIKRTLVVSDFNQPVEIELPE